jgi:hypothetical protein
MELLQDVLIEAGAIDRFLGGSVPINLWRAHNLSKKGVGLFDLVEEQQARAGGMRPADISVENGWGKVRHFPRGISTFDKPNVFPRGKWECYKIPAGTVLPVGLVVVKDHFNSALGATHYTIAPVQDMPLTQFKALPISSQFNLASRAHDGNSKPMDAASIAGRQGWDSIQGVPAEKRDIARYRGT